VKNRFLVILIALLSHTAFGQITLDQMHQSLATYKQLSHVSATHFADMNMFYAALDYKFAWVEKKDRCLALVNILKGAAGIGLDANDYAVDFVESFCNNQLTLVTSKDSADADVRITLTAIQYYHDMAYGNVVPVLGYNGLSYAPSCYNIPGLLAEYISRNNLSSLNIFFASAMPEISILENKIRFFNKIIADSSFNDVIINSNKVNFSNRPLILKLYQLGHIQSINDTLTDKQVKKALQEAQLEFGLLADGTLRSTMLEELNKTISARLQQLSLSVNYYRWLHCLAENQLVIVVNIPAAYMKVYHEKKVILEMRMVLGKRSTPTPTLLSRVREVILYPYWHVPFSIATKELLPHIQKNAAFLEAGNYQVLNLQGKVMDPFAINWDTVSAKKFPYIIRQSTGCDNALGLLKLNFDSPFGVYLHDTPFKDAFSLNKRYFSHGCLRMENPMELGHLVLKNHPQAIDTLEEKGCLRNQSPIVVPADHKMPVLVWYNPAGVDSTGRVLYYEDVYKKFK
jgi:L,D-transpeptidase YcbB